MQANSRPRPNSELHQLLTETEAAEIRRQSKRTLQAERLRGDGCRFVKIGRSVRYRLRDVLEFIELNVRASTSDGGDNGAR